MGLRRAKTACLHCEAFSVSFTGQWSVVGDRATRLTSCTKAAEPCETKRQPMFDSLPPAQVAAHDAMTLLSTVGSQPNAPALLTPCSKRQQEPKVRNMSQPLLLLAVIHPTLHTVPRSLIKTRQMSSTA